MWYGAAYYPEHWPRARWEVDAQMMKQAGLNVVRMGEFAWDRLEPTRGQYRFEWLDEAIAVLAAQGIRTILCTPTASPPKWLMDQLGDAYQQDAQGHARAYGTRRHYCANHTRMREAAKSIAAAMAEHYRKNPNIIAWQVDNEFGCHDTMVCYCPRCAQAFRTWLKVKYTSIGVLNQSWGTAFWGQTYEDFAQIDPPAYAATNDAHDISRGHNPAALLDYQRFSSDSFVHFCGLQADAIRMLDSRPVTTNTLGVENIMDIYDLAKTVDFLALDIYPLPQWMNGGRWTDAALGHDMTRGAKNKAHWVLEQQSGPCGWSTLGRTPPPGLIRLMAWQSVARGARHLVYFRWRACLFGAEQYWYGILDHDGQPTRRLEEIARAGEEMRTAEQALSGARVVSPVALIHTFDNQWSHAIQPHVRGFSYYKTVSRFHDAVLMQQAGCDIVQLSERINEYEMVVAPALNVVSDEESEMLRAFVAKGGILVLTYRSGTKDENNNMRPEALPGAFAALAGIRVEEFDALGADTTVKLRGLHESLPAKGKATLWADAIVPGEDTQVLYEYKDGEYAGKAAVTMHGLGLGSVVYIGCELEEKTLRALLAHLMECANVHPAVYEADEGIEAVVRDKPEQRTLVLLNHARKTSYARLDLPMTDILTGERFDVRVGLPAWGVRVLVPTQNQAADE